jgi:hypothetical protein
VLEALGGDDAVQTRHGEIHDDHVGAKRPREHQAGLRVGRADDAETPERQVLGVQLARRGRVVDDEDERAATAVSSGLHVPGEPGVGGGVEAVTARLAETAA